MATLSKKSKTAIVIHEHDSTSVISHLVIEPWPQDCKCQIYPLSIHPRPNNKMNAKLQEYKASIEKGLNDRSKPWTKYLEMAEQKTGVSKVYIFVGLVAFTGLYLVFGFGAQLICNLIGFVYPAYMSMRALESPMKDDDTKWLTYWVVYACFSCVEYFSDFIVGWFPLYWLIKCIFIIWCYLPTDYNGSLIIYHRIILPYYQKHHSRIDDIANSEDVFKELVANANKHMDKTLKAFSKRMSELHND